MKKIIFSQISLMILVAMIAAAVSANVNGTNVLISEVGINAPGSDLGNEFIELYNPTNGQISIAGWKVVSEGSPKFTLTIPAGAIIRAKGYYLIASQNLAPWTFTAKADYTVSFQDIPTVDFGVKLTNSSDITIDAVGWGSFLEVGYFEGSTFGNLNGIPEPVALERKPGSLSPSCGNWQDTDNNVDDFVLSTNPRLQNSSMTENNCSADSTAPGTVTNLKSINVQTNSIIWNWTRPIDEDFSHAILTLNGINIANTSNSSYQASGLMSNTTYTMSILTSDINGNINPTAVTNTTKTLINPIACSNNSQCNDNNANTEDICLNPGTAQSSCTHTSIRCFTNSDCGTDAFLNNNVCQSNNVWDSRITFTCTNPGIGSASCSNSTTLVQKQVCALGCTSGACNAAPIACSSNPQCNDNNNHTQDTCLNPGLNTSSCQHLAINCINNNDCGHNSYVGSNFCTGKDVFRNYISYTCANANTTSSSCSSSTSPILNQTCAFNCSAGTCVVPIISCDSDIACNDNNPRTSDKCLNAGLPDSSCNYTQIACLSNSDCGTDGLVGDPFCQSVNLFKIMRSYTCLNNGTVNAACNSTNSTALFQTCVAGCADNSCLADSDNDTIADNIDNCPSISNTNQSDSDSDNVGDVCDACPTDSLNDADHDGMCAEADMCPADGNNDLVDQDEVCADADNCKNFFNDDQVDSNNNGIGDACDCTQNPEHDMDLDGICDEADRFNSDSSSNSSDPNCVKVYIDGQEITDPVGVANVELKRCDNNQTVVDFMYDFSADSLDLTNVTVTISETASGSVIVDNLDLGSGAEDKTVYVKAILGSNKLCIKDEAQVQDFQVSGDCTNGIQLLCDAINGQYACQRLSDYYKVTGLRHSAVVEYSFTSTPGSGSSSGGGGGSGSSTKKCSAAWECTEWSSCVNSFEKRTCIDRNNCTGTLAPETSRRCTSASSVKPAANNPQTAPSTSDTSSPGNSDGNANATSDYSADNSTSKKGGLLGLTGLAISNLNNLWNTKQKKIIATVILMLLLLLFLVLFLRTGKKGKGSKGKKAKARLFFGMLAVLTLVGAAYAGVGTSVVISEVSYNPIDGDNMEYIELYNPTASAIDISGWKIFTYSTTSASVVIPNGSTIQPHSFYLIGEHQDTWPASYAKADTYQRLYLINSNSGIKLKDLSGQTIDAIGWGAGIPTGHFEGTAVSNNPNAGQSFERKPGYLAASCGNYEDTNNNAADLIINPHPLPWNSSYTEENCLQDIVAPGQATGLQSISKTNVSITWTWNNPLDEDFKNAIVMIGGVNVVNTTSGTYTSTGLMPSTPYTISIKTIDINNNVNDNSVSNTETTSETAETEKQLSIIGQSISGITNSSALIEWGTNLDATTKVEYGTTASLGSESIIPGASTTHSVSLVSLVSNTTYYYKLSSCYNASLCNSSATLQFKTSTNSVLDLKDDLQVNYLRAKITIDGTPAVAGYQYKVKVKSGNNSGYEIAGTVETDVDVLFAGNGYLYTGDNIAFSTGANFLLSAPECTETASGTFANGGNGDFSNASSMLLLNCTSAPVVRNVSYAPSSPTDQDNITIYVNASDNYGISDAKIVYSVNDGALSEMLMNLVSGLYTADIGKFQPNSTIKLFASVSDAFASTTISQNITIFIGENDLDHDGIWDEIDNCLELGNPDQHDSDNDGKGDLCDPAECNDSSDNDADSLTDLADPGCDNENDNNETDECYTDLDCSSLDQVYCLSNAVANDTGKCVNSKCVADTQVLDDCGGRTDIWNECGAVEWSCSEEINTVTCVLSNVAPDNDLCADECIGTDLSKKTCNQTTYMCDSAVTQCTDADSYTEDTCLVNDIHNSTCMNLPIACINSADCGTDGFIGSPFCELDNVWSEQISFSCINANTSASYCSNATINATMENCAFGCTDARCINESEITCFNNSMCDDSNAYTEDVCLAPGLLNSTCTHTQIQCFSAADCGLETVDSVCNGLDNVINTTTPACMDAGTTASVCINSSNVETLGCSNICSADMHCDYTECSDGTDNDADNYTDFPADLGCSGYEDDDESDGIVNCTSNLDCGNASVLHGCIELTFNTETTTPTCFNASTEYSYCSNLTETGEENCMYLCSDEIGCDYCTPNMTYTEWTDWTNNMCDLEQMNQTRDRIYYDQNSCGVFQNNTEMESRLVGPEFTNSTWSEWDNITACMPEDFFTQERNLTQTDSFACAPSTVFHEYQNQTCDFCTPELANTTWSEWTDVTCDGEQMNQSRFLTQYDINFCGEVSNETITDFRNVGPEFTNSTWSEWQNITGCLAEDYFTQERNLTQTDSFACAPSTAFYEYQNQTCDFCTPELANTTWSEWTDVTCDGEQMNQSRFLTQYDINFCGEVSNETIADFRNVGPEFTNSTWSGWDNITECMPGDHYTQQRNLTQTDSFTCAPSTVFYEYQNQTCDYCTPELANTTWSEWTDVTCDGEQMNQSRFLTQYDMNYCGEVSNETITDFRNVGPEFTNSTWSGWDNITECMPGDYYTQQRNLTQTDSFACAPSTVFYEYQNQTCDYCTPLTAETEWSTWSNVSCLDDNTMNQTRSKITYDSNYCGEIQNETIIEFRDTEFCDFCTPSIGNTEWTSWSNVSCLADNTMNQTRSNVAYDTNYCGEVDNETVIESRNTEFCDFCTPLVTYTAWSDWSDLSCLSTNTLNQSRTRVEYDLNSCGEFDNVTEIHYRNTEYCDYCTPNMTFTEWNDWQNESCVTGDVMNQSRSRIRFDLNSCGENANESFVEERTFGYCDFCTPNMITISTSDWTNVSCLPSDLMNQTRTNVWYDTNYCGEQLNITGVEFKTDLTCDYCTPDMTYSEWTAWENLSCQAGNVMNQTRSRTLSDANSCSEIQDTTETEYRIYGTCSYRQCSDGIDNDADGYVDYPDDLGCESLDDNNEADGLIACTANADCGDLTTVGSCNALDSMITSITPLCILPGSERSYCTNQSTIISIDHCDQICSAELGCDYTQCSDSEDNDLDSYTDFPSDKGCSNIYDNDESDGLVVCSADIDCGAQRVYSECSGLSLMTTTVTPMCQNAGTEYSFCSNSSESVTAASCSHICSAQSGCDYTQCANNIDDDFDGFVDFPSDYGCDNFNDNNEADGSVNCTQDSDCGSIESSSVCTGLSFTTAVQTPKCNNGGTERSYCSFSAVSDSQNCNNICSDSAGCDYTQCSNRIDDDADNTVDFGQDLGCSSFLDNVEGDGAVQCSADSDCGTTYNVLTCSSDALDLTVTTVIPHCMNPGLESSMCYATASNSSQTCSNTCDTTNGCDYIPVSAYITANPERGILPLNVSFTAVANGMGEISYSWDFDSSDGIQQQSTVAGPDVLYTREGNYTVTLTVTTTGGQIISVTKIVEVLPIYVAPPRLQGQLSVERIIIGDDSDLKAGEMTRVSIVFRNSGDFKLENVRVQFAIPELGISRTSAPMTISKGDKTTKTMEILVPAGVKGEYTARITVFSSESKRVHHRDVMID